MFFRYQADEPSSFVDLRGEMLDFGTPIELTEVAPGVYEKALSLEPGVYAYKLRHANGRWVLDPRTSRTRGRDGVVNSMLVVDGADEPVLYAPVAPFLYLHDDGLVIVRAGLRKGAAPDGLSLRYDEGHGVREIAMQYLCEEDQHRFFEARIPISARELEHCFVLGDGTLVGGAGGAAQCFRVALRDLAHEVPDWWKDAVIYTVFVDRFRQGGTGGAFPEIDHPEARAGGDLRGVVEALPHLESLGITAIHLTPISLSRSAHRYDAIDPRAIDPAIGGEAALAELIAAARSRGIRVIADFAVTHVHRDNPHFLDVRQRGVASPYFDWFFVQRFPFSEGPFPPGGIDPGYRHYQKGQWEEPLLDLSRPAVVEYVLGTFDRYASLGVDGFRVDAAADLPRSLLGAIQQRVRQKNREAVVFGEVIPPHLASYLRAGLDAATDFAGQSALHALALERDAAKASAVWTRRELDRGGPGYRAIGFVATHDQHRLLTHVRDPRLVRLAHFVVMMRPEVPALYYGDEIGLHAERAGHEFEGAWSDRQCFPWDDASWDRETLEVVRAAIALRRSHDVLRRGDLVPLPGDREVLAFRRVHAERVIDVVVNVGDTPRRVPLAPGAPSAATVRMTLGEASLDGDVHLGPLSAIAIERVATAQVEDAIATLRAHNRALIGDAYRSGATETVSLPAHLYVTVTEACNLRCAHCITRAPLRTRDGTARWIAPWVLEALAQPFAAAEYFGFAHGGESLVSPMFFPTLEAIRGARRGRKTDVHLLTNGMKLDEPTVARLIDHGVTSLAVSIDGATAATNDAIRLGGRLETICANVRGAVDLRRRLGADLRIGVSTVIGRFNVGELAQLGELVVSLGVDWLKIEELHPVNLLSAEQLIRGREPAIRAGVPPLASYLEKHGVVLVDHLDAPAGCPCEAARAPHIARFRAADDFANRARFFPCRMPWEQACVDPDGTVHAVDFFSAPLGNLAERSFLDLWNGAEAQGQRRAALERVSRVQRERCPFDRVG